MLEKLINLDRALFHKINVDWHHPWADAFFPAITDLHKNWFFKFIFVPWLLFVFVRQYGKKGVSLFLGLLLALGTADFFGGQVVKPYFERTRPSRAEPAAVVRGKEYGGFSFTSNHSSNTFTAAVYGAMWIPQGRIIFLTIAALVGYSRVYVGVHYPLDVFFGMLMGIFWGYMWVRISEKVLHMKRPVRHG